MCGASVARALRIALRPLSKAGGVGYPAARTAQSSASARAGRARAVGRVGTYSERRQPPPTPQRRWSHAGRRRPREQPARGTPSPRKPAWPWSDRVFRLGPSKPVVDGRCRTVAGRAGPRLAVSPRSRSATMAPVRALSALAVLGALSGANAVTCELGQPYALRSRPPCARTRAASPRVRSRSGVWLGWRAQPPRGGGRSGSAPHVAARATVAPANRSASVHWLLCAAVPGRARAQDPPSSGPSKPPRAPGLRAFAPPA